MKSFLLLFSLVFLFLASKTEARKRGLDAIVTIVEREEDVQSACVLGRSLERHMTNYYPDPFIMIILIDRNINKDAEEFLLTECGWMYSEMFDEGIDPLREVEETIGAPRALSNYSPYVKYASKHREASFNELMVLQLPYDRVMYLSPHTMVRENIHHLFNCIDESSNSTIQFCAYQNRVHEDGEPIWDIDIGVMVFTPSTYFYKDLMDNAINLDITKDMGSQGVLSRYLYWTCTTGEADVNKIAKEDIPNFVNKPPVADACLWISKEKRCQESNTGTLPMTACRRLEERFNVHKDEDEIGHPLAAVVNFKDPLSRPYFWQTSIQVGYYKEYRSYASIFCPTFVIILFTIFLIVVVHARQFLYSDLHKITLTARHWVFIFFCSIISPIVANFFYLSFAIPTSAAPFVGFSVLFFVTAFISTVFTLVTFALMFKPSKIHASDALTLFCIFLIIVIVHIITIVALLPQSSIRLNTASSYINTGIIGYATTVFSMIMIRETIKYILFRDPHQSSGLTIDQV